MSPIIELQRRMVEAGRIRAGEKGDKGEPRKLSHWRLTSKDRQRLDEASDLWGGQVRAWDGHAGEFELYTETDVLPIILVAGQGPSSWMELWSRGGIQRRCDGLHEQQSDKGCICKEEDDMKCKPTTRISVLLPDLPGIGSWLVASNGWNAAAEFSGLAEVLRHAPEGALLEARLKLEQRTDVSNGQTRHFAVPSVYVDKRYREILGTQGALSAPSERAALPSGYVPLTGNGGNGVSLEQGLVAAETQTAQRTARSAAPIPAQDDLDFGDEPVPVADDSGASPPSSASVVPQSPDATPAAPQTSEASDERAGSRSQEEGPRSPTPGEGGSDAEGAGDGGTHPGSDPGDRPSRPNAPKDGDGEKKITPAQKKFLGYMVRVLRDDAKHITTENLWASLARTRNVEVDTMIELLEGRDAEGALHFGPLLASLTRGEASELIDRLLRLEENLAKGQA